MSPVIVNFSIFTIDDFYHPNLFYFYRIFWEISLIITTIFFVFMLYVILKNSKEIGEYKYFMIHQLVWSYLFDVLLGTWKPITLWPFYIGFGIGWFRSWRGIWALVPFYAVVATAVGMGVSIFMSFLHRYINVSPISFLARLYQPFTFKLFFYGFLFILMESMIMIPIFVSYVDVETLQKSITSKYPMMTFFFENEPSIFGYDPVLNNQFTVLYMFCVIFFFIGIVLFCILMYFNFIRLMKKNSFIISHITQQMQLTLFRTLYLQISLVLTLLVIPFLLSIFFAAFGIR